MSIHPIVLCGPSGSGKSTIIKRLMQTHQGVFAFSVSHTTRQPRPGEVDGKDYHFVDASEMRRLMEADEFVETAEFSGNRYGTSKAAVRKVAEAGKVCLLDIDSQGVRLLKRQSELKPKYVFVQPPSLETLEKRLRDRGTETEEKVLARLAAAKAEMEYGNTPGNFDIVIVNDDLDRAVAQLEEFLAEDIHRVKVGSLQK